VTGAELFVQCLRNQGVEWASALCGNGLNDILAACHAAGIRVIDTRNEQTAAYMAESWGRLSGRVGVCLASSGVAHANALAGVVNAYFDGAPMLLVTGAGPRRTAGAGHFQDLDHVSLAAPVCKFAQVIDAAERIPELVHRAFAAALSGRPGPVHLTFPMDVQQRATAAPPAPAAVAPVGAAPGREAVRRALELFAAARRPVLVAGSGVYYAGAQTALLEFAAAWALPIMVPIWDRGCVPAPCAEFMGVTGAASGDPRVLADADLLVLVGAELDYRTGYGRPGPGGKLVRIQADPARLAHGRADLDIVADPGAALRALDEAAAAHSLAGYEPWLAEACQRRDEFMAAVRASARRDGEALHALDLIDAIAAELPAEAVLIVDGGNIGQWFHQTLGRRQYPGHWLTCGASGVVGFGVGAAMAAGAGFPRRPVVLLSGDGAATFTLTDLERAAGQQLPFVMIVADDQRWGIVETGQLARYGAALSSRLGEIDFATLADSLGAIGARATTATQLRAALRQGLAERRPVVIHAPICGGSPAAAG